MAIIKGTATDNKLVGLSDFSKQPVNTIYGLDGNDTLTGGLFAENHIWGGNGNDKLTAGAYLSRLYGDGGNDYLDAFISRDAKLYGGAGSDTLIAARQYATYLDGGAGADYMEGGDKGDTFVVNQKDDVVADFFVPQSPTAINPADTVRASISYNLGSRIENLELLGTAALSGAGNGSANQLLGNSAANVLNGLAGRDILIGGLGADDLYGGSGVDSFVYKTLSDTTVAASGRDTIFDFVAGDRIDLSAIDASTKTAGNGGFTFIGQATFHKIAGELRYDLKASDTYVYGDVNGDGKADFSIHLDDAVALQKGFFVL